MDSRNFTARTENAEELARIFGRAWQYQGSYILPKQYENYALTVSKLSYTPHEHTEQQPRYIKPITNEIIDKNIELVRGLENSLDIEESPSKEEKEEIVDNEESPGEEGWDLKSRWTDHDVKGDYYSPGRHWRAEALSSYFRHYLGDYSFYGDLLYYSDWAPIVWISPNAAEFYPELIAWSTPEGQSEFYTRSILGLRGEKKTLPHIQAILTDGAEVKNDGILRSEICFAAGLMITHYHLKRFKNHLIIPVYIYSFCHHSVRILECYYDGNQKRLVIRKTEFKELKVFDEETVKLCLRWMMSTPCGDTKDLPSQEENMGVHHPMQDLKGSSLGESDARDRDGTAECVEMTGSETTGSKGFDSGSGSSRGDSPQSDESGSPTQKDGEPFLTMELAR